MGKNIFLKYFVIGCFLSAFTSCEKEALFDAGKTITKEVSITGTISIIKVNSMFDITLVQDTINKAFVTCGENLLPNIDIFVKDEILHINNSIKNSWSRDYKKVKLELHLISIPRIDVRKPVYITTQDTFKTNEFFLIDWGDFTELDVTLDVKSCCLDVSSNSFGHYTLKGKSVNTTLNGWGSSFIYADELQSQNCTVKQRSIGDIYVNALNKLSVTIETTGKVYYYGDPSTIEMNNNFSPQKLIHLIR